MCLDAAAARVSGCCADAASPAASDANLAGAILSSARLGGATIKNADFSGVIIRKARRVVGEHRYGTPDVPPSSLIAQDILEKVCDLPTANGTNPVTQVDTRESLMCP